MCNTFREPIACGQKVRLEHLATKKNLHSHLFSSPLSDQQEISAFGVNGEGDSGDVWVVICDDEFWNRQDTVLLRHVDTDMWVDWINYKYIWWHYDNMLCLSDQLEVLKKFGIQFWFIVFVYKASTINFIFTNNKWIGNDVSIFFKYGNTNKKKIENQNVIFNSNPINFKCLKKKDQNYI